jgi:hypothetical protein
MPLNSAKIDNKIIDRQNPKRNKENNAVLARRFHPRITLAI